MLPIDTVAVLGATEAGTACAVRVFDPSNAALDRAFDAVRRRVDLALAAGAITRTERQRILDGVVLTSEADDALTGADLAVDASHSMPEQLFSQLAAALRATAAVAAAGGTSAAELAARLPQPGRVLGLQLTEAHGPVPRLDVVPGSGTEPHVLDRARAFAARVNRATRLAPVAPAAAGGGGGA